MCMRLTFTCYLVKSPYVEVPSSCLLEPEISIVIFEKSYFVWQKYLVPQGGMSKQLFSYLSGGQWVNLAQLYFFHLILSP